MQKKSRRVLAETSQKGTALAATVFLAPALIMIAMYMIYPVIDTFVTSQYQWNGISADKLFIGLENWKTLLQDYKFWDSFAHNLIDRVMPAFQGSDARHPLVGKTLSIIERQYGEAINLASISDQLGVTPEYLSYLFHRDMGINFSAYLRNWRIDRATALMRGGRTRIYDIARAVGFNDAKYFCRVFREVTGQSPGTYLRGLTEEE